VVFLPLQFDTAIMLAVKSGHPECVRLLLKAGAELSAKNLQVSFLDFRLRFLLRLFFLSWLFW
jgi:ankyrin repeat protein